MKYLFFNNWMRINQQQYLTILKMYISAVFQFTFYITYIMYDDLFFLSYDSDMKKSNQTFI